MMASPLSDIDYEKSLARHIKHFFMKTIITENFLLCIHRHDVNVLTNSDIERLRKKLTTFSRDEVNADILDLFPSYSGWFDCMLNVLRDPELKQKHLVQKFEDLKNEHDSEWKKHNDQIPVTVSSNSSTTVYSMHGDIALGQPEGRDMRNVLKVMRGNIASDCVSSLDKLSLEESSKDWYLTNGKGYCKVCKIELTSEQHKNQHIEGRSHKNKLHRCSLDGQKNVNMHQSEKEEERADIQDYKFCHACQLSLTSPQDAEQHYNGAKHKKKVEALKGSNPTAVTSNANNSEGVDNDEYCLDSNGKGKCKICSVLFTSNEVASEHLKGKIHMKKLAQNPKSV